MSREEKIKRKKERAKRRWKRNIDRNQNRRTNRGLDCPYDVDIHGSYGTCHCGGKNYSDCAGDI